MDLFSSSVSPPPPSSIPDRPHIQTRPLPDELVTQISIYLEEELYLQAITLLSNILTSGTNSSGPAFIPPSYHLSFVHTLSLHPRFTTHALTPERQRISTGATSYLSTLLHTVGSLAAGFPQAYAFNTHKFLRGGRRRANQAADSDNSSDDSNPDEALESDLAQSQNFFRRADGFWAALGWAFTCSVLHARRWETWRIWCEHMLRLLETDWSEREALAGDNRDWYHKTLLARYMGDISQASLKRVLRSIFACGNGHEFSEIWKDETKRKRGKAKVLRKRIKLDIEAGQLGDYAGPSSDEDENASSDEDVETSRSSLGGPEALAYRMRVLALVGRIPAADAASGIDLDTLCAACLSHLRPLPLNTLHPLLSAANLAYFAPETASLLLQYLTRSFLEVSALSHTVDELSWPLLSRAYAPYASSGSTGASTVGDNGKVGVCIEVLVQLTRARLGYSPLQGRMLAELVAQRESLWVKIEEGCVRRMERAENTRRAKKGEAGSEFDYEETREFEIRFLMGARLRLALLMGVKI